MWLPRSKTDQFQTDEQNRDSLLPSGGNGYLAEIRPRGKQKDGLHVSVTDKQRKGHHVFRILREPPKGVETEGVSKVTPHSFQKGFATKAIEQGIQIARILLVDGKQTHLLNIT